MPPHDAPYRPRDVRDLYARGTWAYALGRAAWTHHEYKRVDTKAKRAGWNPWWIRNWADVEAVKAGCWMDEKAGRNKADFFDLLRQFEGEFAGKPMTLLDWTRYDVMIPLFGWKRPDGTRRYRRGHIEIAKKNGKTTISGGVVLLLLCGDGEPGAEVYTAAVDRKQAGKMYRAAHEMGRRSPALSKVLEFVPSRYRIVHRASASYYEALSADVASKEGLNAHGVVEDEMHVYPNRAMHDTLKHAGAARRQPLNFAITTAGVYDPTSIGWEQHEYANRILHAINDAHTDWTFFPYICGLAKDEEELFAEPAMAVKANPSIGVTVKAAEIADVVREATLKPSEVNVVKRYRFNVWTAQLDAWMPLDKWDACGAAYGEADLEGQTCYLGLDNSLSGDITALCAVFPPQDGRETWRVLPWFWVPEGGIPKFDEQYNGWYSQWRNAGHLIATPGDRIDQEHIRQHMHALRDKFAVRTIGYDAAFASKLAQDLQNDGFDVGAFGQGYAAMNEPTTRLMELVLDRSIEHPRNPVLTWHISNAQAVTDGGGRIRIVKTWGNPGRARTRFKIDGVHALIMALGTAELDDTPVEIEHEVIWG